MAENKIISYDVELLSTNKRREFYIPEIYTNDLYSTEFQFNVLDVPVSDLAGATATVLLNMRDGSFFNNTDVIRSGNVFKYILKENEGNHFGIAEVQLVVVIGGKDYATPIYNFAVMQGLDDKKANEVVINDLNSETRKEIAKLKSETNTIITDLSAQFQQVIDETTGKDVISAPELIAARNGEANLKTRIDKDYQEITAQLANIEVPDVDLTNYATLNYVDDLHDSTTAQLQHTWKNIHSYPKEVGDTSDSQRINRMIAESNDYDTIYLPNQEEPYIVDDTVLVDKRLNFRVEGIVHVAGSKDKPGFQFVRPFGNQIYFNQIRDDNKNTKGFDWSNDNYIGIFVQGAYQSTIHIEQVIGFAVGVKLQAKNGIGDSGFWFNNITIKRINDCLIGYELNSDGSGAWFNANEFHESAIGYGGGSTTAVGDRYNIKQTLTNGNMYGGNNNYFYNFKLETHGGFNGSHTMVQLGRAIDWVFRDFRKEVTNAGSNEREFVMDMSYNRDDVATRVAHSTNNLITGVYNFKIEFDNVGQLKDSFHNIIRNERDVLKPLVKFSDLSDKAKRVNVNNSILSNHVSSSLTDQTLDSESTVFFKANGIKQDGYIEVPSTATLTQYITNVSKLNTFRIETKSSVGVQFYDVDGNIIEDIRDKVVGYMLVNTSAYSIRPTSNDPLEFSIVDETIKTMKIKLFGSIRNVELLTDSATAIHKRSLNPDLFKSGGFYSNSKPVFDKTFGFVVGDVVMNTKSSSSTPDGWQLQYSDGQYTWIDLL